MRTTFNATASSLVEYFNRLSTQYAQYQAQAASGQRITLPADDPLAADRLLSLQADAQLNNQFQSNISRLRSDAGTAYSAIRSLKTIVDRANEIATLADATKSPEDLNNYATEVNQLILQAVQSANISSNGRYLFAGSSNDQPPFQAITGANGDVTGVTYAGDTTVPAIEIAAGHTITATPPGANTTGTGDQGLLIESRTGADLFGHLVALASHLRAADTASIQNSDRAALAADEKNLLTHVALNGAVQARLDSAEALARSRLEALNADASSEADADLAMTLLRLNQTQTAYTAALQTGGSLLKLSLLDYLR